MTGRDSARAQIADLVQRFAQDKARNKLAAYNEDQTRHYYILPLFRALGWDTSNPAEFTAEEQISRGFVDFGFYLNSIPAFYLETKRVTERLDKPENMRQSINYAYLRGVTWAVLTDFEQLMVFNADWEEKDPLKTRFLHLHAESYATDGFEDLWLLSKAAMSQSPRAIDRTAERYGKKDKKQPVTELIYRNLTDWRAQLFKQIRLLDDTLWASDPTIVDNAVQKLFDRLIFLRSVEDRGIEAPRLQPIVRAVGVRGNPWPSLLTLFREMDGVYDSNLFEQHHLDSMTVHDPGLVKEIINGLYTIGGTSPIRLDFNAISADVLGRVYEQYLAFKADDPEAQTTTKSKKRKTQGIFYTPQYVVRYIIHNTIGRLLREGAHPADLRIVDPACGSGSFLIEAFDALDRAFHQREPDATPQRRTEWRKHILTECLYGVDLDEQAVEVTRLNLILRAALSREKLPRLTHIKHGNSLVSDPSVAGADLAFDWHVKFDTVFARGGFDAVIGNPPYGAKITADERQYLAKRFETGNSDTAALMIALAYDIAKGGSEIGFIVPKAIAYASNWEKLRDKLTPELTILADVSKAWKEVNLEQIVFVVKKEEKNSTYDSFFYDTEKESFNLSTTISKADCELFGFWLNGVSQEELTVGKKALKGKQKLGELTHNVRGAMLQKYVKKSKTIGRKIAGGKHIRDLSIEVKDSVIIDAVEIPKQAYVAVNSILVQNIVAHIANPKPHIKITSAVVTEKDKDLLILDTVNQLTNFSNYDSKFLMACLRSKLINWWVYRFIFAKAIRTMHFDKTASDRIPIPRVNLNDPNDKAKHDQLVSLVEQMLALKQRLASETFVFNDTRHELEESIARVDAQIDRAVYALYGLDAEDIRVIEGA